MSALASKSARNWGMLCHLTAFSVFVGVPLGNILGPLIIWLVKKNEYAFVDYHGKESLNFQISMTIYYIIAAVLIIVLIGWLLLGVLVVLNIVLVIIASIKASDGELYEYPFTIRLIK
jgi:hypothetical protein